MNFIHCKLSKERNDLTEQVWPSMMSLEVKNLTDETKAERYGKFYKISQRIIEIDAQITKIRESRVETPCTCQQLDRCLFYTWEQNKKWMKKKEEEDHLDHKHSLKTTESVSDGIFSFLQKLERDRELVEKIKKHEQRDRAITEKEKINWDFDFYGKKHTPRETIQLNRDQLAQVILSLHEQESILRQNTSGPNFSLIDRVIAERLMYEELLKCGQ